MDKNFQNQEGCQICVPKLVYFPWISGKSSAESGRVGSSAYVTRLQSTLRLVSSLYILYVNILGRIRILKCYLQ